MRKLLVAVLAFFAVVNANAKTSGIQDVQPKGGFNMSLMIGTPPACGSDLDWATQDAKMPNLAIDGNWTLTSGMFNAGKFGRNGAIDLGFYYGFCAYQNKYDDEIKCQQHVMAIRCAFHFEFVPKFDVYTGMMSGVNILVPYGDDKDGWYNDYYVTRDTQAEYCMGPFIGCKYFFTDNFGLKAEFCADFASDAAAGANFGLAFKF